MIRLILLVCLPALVVHSSYSGNTTHIKHKFVQGCAVGFPKTNVSTPGKTVRYSSRCLGILEDMLGFLGGGKKCHVKAPTCQVGPLKIKPPKRGRCHTVKRKKVKKFKKMGCFERSCCPMCGLFGNIFTKGMEMMQKFKWGLFNTITFPHRDEEVMVYPDGSCSIVSNDANSDIRMAFPEGEKPEEPANTAGAALNLCDAIKAIFKCLTDVLGKFPNCFDIDDGKVCGMQNITQGTDVTVNNAPDDKINVTEPVTLPAMTLNATYTPASRGVQSQPLQINVNPIAARAEAIFTKGKHLTFEKLQITLPKIKLVDLGIDKSTPLAVFATKKLKLMEEGLRKKLAELGKKVTKQAMKKKK